MGFRFFDIRMFPGFNEEDLREKIFRATGTGDFTFFIENQSLDARNKNHIFWQMRIGVTSGKIKTNEPPQLEKLVIPYRKRNEKVIVTGCGPSGFFAAYVLLLGGFDVTIIEQGNDAITRSKDITLFEKSGKLNESSNYAFGEGGAGTFSDGKLTSRTKTISKEKHFIFDTYIEAGAPPEIAYLSKPHLGSDNLLKMVVKLRKMFENKGGRVLFGTEAIALKTIKNKVLAVETTKGTLDADHFIFSAGHSAYRTFEMLIRGGVPFTTKAFAIGARAEHPQEIINHSQWGRTSIPGINSAEYKLTFNDSGFLPVYSFCMCPGGKVVPAAPYEGLNIVNGMSRYKRDSGVANAGIVAAIHPDRLAGKTVDALGAIDTLRKLEYKFFELTGSFKAPACNISDFPEGKGSPLKMASSYPFGVTGFDFRTLLPPEVHASIGQALRQFSRKIKGYEKGIILGLESKTSSPVRAVRDESGKCPVFDNLFITGEGSGYAGGIVSSAADGIKAAMNILKR